MAKPLHKVTVGGSLKALAKFYKLGVKGTEIENALGKRKSDFTKAQLDAYMEYCANDVELTYDLFKCLVREFPQEELQVIDMTIRMYTEPKIALDTNLLKRHLVEVQERKQKLLDGLGGTEQAKKMLMSNEMFAKLLRKMGVEPPTKVSPATGKTAYAFAKTDKGFTDLLEHENPMVAAIVQARLGVKSTIEETRTQALIEAAGRGRLPIMLNYYGAHTGRFSGGDGLNLQNLPSRKNNTIRRALTAPPGHKLMAVDSSQIEARMVAYLAGQDDLVQAFREGRDVYSEFATDIYGYKVDKSKKIERFVGKTCIAEGTLVLSDSGWKPIETVSTADKLWDGEEWVCHQGLQNNGTKKTLSLCGAWMTPDHQVWSGMQWLDAQLVVADESTLYQVLDTGAENLPSQATLLASEVGSVPLWLDAIATTRNIGSTSIILRTSEAQGALYAPRKQQLQSGIGCIAKLCKTMHTGLGYLTDSLRPLLGATHLTTVPTNTMADGVSGYAMSGDLIEPRSYGMCRLSKGGTPPILRWIGSTWTGTTNQGISDSSQGAITSRTNVKSQTLKTVYDILNCGSRNRFTILTDAGPVIVHNCILGLGYGMGHAKLKDTLESGAMGLKVDIDEFEAKRIINVYRNRYSMIAQFWDKCNNALRQMLMGNSGEVHPLVNFTPKGFQLPNGLFIQYPGLMAEGNQVYYISDSRLFQRVAAAKVSRESLPTDKMTKIYGGKAVENVVQAMARLVITDQMKAISKLGYHVTFQVHDEIICTVPEDRVEQAYAELLEVMAAAPKWAPDLPVACEGGYGDNYGEIEK